MTAAFQISLTTSYSSFISIRIFSCQVKACFDYLNPTPSTFYRTSKFYSVLMLLQEKTGIFWSFISFTTQLRIQLLLWKAKKSRLLFSKILATFDFMPVFRKVIKIDVCKYMHKFDQIISSQKTITSYAVICFWWIVYREWLHIPSHGCTTLVPKYVRNLLFIEANYNLQIIREMRFKRGGIYSNT